MPLLDMHQAGALPYLVAVADAVGVNLARLLDGLRVIGANHLLRSKDMAPVIDKTDAVTRHRAIVGDKRPARL